MKKLFILINIFILFIGCSDKSIHPNMCLIDSSTTTTYEADKLSSMLSFFDITPLETNDDCLISDIDVIKKRNGKYYIQSGRKYLHAFDENGKFLRRIGNIGGGPGEYTLLSDFDVDKENIYLLTVKKIYVYNLEGEFQKEIPLKENVRTIKCVKDGFLTFINCQEGENGLGFLNKNGKMTQTAMNRNETLRIVKKVSWLEWKEDTYIFQMAQSNDLYCFDNEKKEFYRGGYATNYTNAISFEELSNMDKLNPTEYSGIILDGFTSSNSQIIFGGMNKGDISLYIYDKQEQTSHNITLKSIQDDITFSESTLFVQHLGESDSDDDNLITYIETNVLKEAVEKKGRLNEKTFSKLNDTDEEHNPTIISFKFKK